jgi:hypothetical protein
VRYQSAIRRLSQESEVGQVPVARIELTLQDQENSSISTEGVGDISTESNTQSLLWQNKDDTQHSHCQNRNTTAFMLRHANGKKKGITGANLDVQRRVTSVSTASHTFSDCNTHGALSHPRGTYTTQSIGPMFHLVLHHRDR